MSNRTKQVSTRDVWREPTEPFRGVEWKALIGVRRPFLSLLLCIIGYPLWFEHPTTSKQPVFWWDLAISILPTLTGVIITAFAIMCTLGNERFRELYMVSSYSDNADYGIYNKIAAPPFLFLVLVQVGVLVIASCAKAWSGNYPGIPALGQNLMWAYRACSLIGSFLFFYSVISTCVSMYLIYSYMGWQARFQKKQQQKALRDTQPVDAPVPVSKDHEVSHRSK